MKVIYKTKINMSTPYKRSGVSELTMEFLKTNNIISKFGHAGAMVYKCGCCHDNTDKWEWASGTKKHVLTEKHKKANKNFNKMKSKYENQCKKTAEQEEITKGLVEDNKEIKKRLVENEEIKKRLDENNKDLLRQLYEYHGKDIVQEFLKECEEADYIHKSLDDEVSFDGGKTITRQIIYVSAPTTFDELYGSFNRWCDCLIRTNDMEEGQKKDEEYVKSMMIKFQEESAYGLEIGECDEYLKKNGTMENPKFNFKHEDEFPS